MGTSSVGPVVSEFTITIEQNRDFEFTVRFDKPQYPAWLLDEPAPLGRDSGPGAARALAAAIGNCLSASLLFCARKSRIELGRSVPVFAPKLAAMSRVGFALAK